MNDSHRYHFDSGMFERAGGDENVHGRPCSLCGLQEEAHDDKRLEYMRRIYLTGSIYEYLDVPKVKEAIVFLFTHLERMEGQRDAAIGALREIALGYNEGSGLTDREYARSYWTMAHDLGQISDERWANYQKTRERRDAQ